VNLRQRIQQALVWVIPLVASCDRSGDAPGSSAVQADAATPAVVLDASTTPSSGGQSSNPSSGGATASGGHSGASAGNGGAAVSGGSAGEGGSSGQSSGGTSGTGGSSGGGAGGAGGATNAGVSGAGGAACTETYPGFCDDACRQSDCFEQEKCSALNQCVWRSQCSELEQQDQYPFSYCGIHGNVDCGDIQIQCVDGRALGCKANDWFPGECGVGEADYICEHNGQDPGADPLRCRLMGEPRLYDDPDDARGEAWWDLYCCNAG